MVLSTFQLCVATLVLLLLFYIVQIILNAFQTDLRKIPGPTLSRFTNWPLKIQVLTGNRTFYIDELHKAYGPIVRIAPNEVAVADFDSYRQIHRIGTTFIKSPWYHEQVPSQHDDETCGVFGIRDPRKAHARRKLFQQAGTRAAVHGWEPRIVEIVNQAMDMIGSDLKAKGKADVFKWFTAMTTDVLGELAFGEPFRMVEKGEVMNADRMHKPQLVRDIQDAMMAVGVRQELRLIWEILYRVPLKSVKHVFHSHIRLRDAGYVAVRNTKEAPKGSGKTIFLKMYPEDGSPLFSDDLMADEAANLIVAGSDTTGVGLTYLVYCVLSTPDVKRRLLEELATLPENASWEELESANYLNNTIQESLRMYPSVPGSLPRTTPESGAILGGYRIPGGTTVVTQAYTLHRDPTVFEDPNSFNPGRWSNSGKEMREHFAAFGGNARTCLGQNIARLELLHAVSKFFKRFPDVRLADSASPEMMKPLDFFVFKPRAGKFEVVLK